MLTILERLRWVKVETPCVDDTPCVIEIVFRGLVAALVSSLGARDDGECCIEVLTVSDGLCFKQVDDARRHDSHKLFVIVLRAIVLEGVRAPFFINYPTIILRYVPLSSTSLRPK